MSRIRGLRILLLCIAIIGFLPIYIWFATYVSETFFDDGYQHVAEITEETYEEIAHADAMFLELPDGVSVKEVYVKKVFDGDTYLKIYVEASDSNADDYEQSLIRNKQKYSRDGNMFCFTYFESRTSHLYQFDDLVSNEMETKVCRIFRICYGVMVVLLLIPFELHTNCKQLIGYKDKNR